MWPSVIQLLEMQYLGIKVRPQPLENFKGQNITPFDFNDVEIGECSETNALTNDEIPRTYVVMLRIVIENKTGKIAPYDIDVGVVGRFKINKEIPEEMRENLITVNGCSMLYSSIREQVMTLTARSVNGMLMLPTVNFQYKIENKKELKQNKKTTGTKRRSTKKKT